MVANVQKAIKLIYLIQVVANVPATDVRTFYKNVRVVPSEAPIKLIYLGDTERLTTEMGERRGWENLTNQPGACVTSRTRNFYGNNISYKMTTEAQVSQSYILYVFGADKCHPSFSYIDSFYRRSI